MPRRTRFWLATPLIEGMEKSFPDVWSFLRPWKNCTGRAHRHIEMIVVVICGRDCERAFASSGGRFKLFNVVRITAGSSTRSSLRSLTTVNTCRYVLLHREHMDHRSVASCSSQVYTEQQNVFNNGAVLLRCLGLCHYARVTNSFWATICKTVRPIPVSYTHLTLPTILRV